MEFLYSNAREGKGETESHKAKTNCNNLTSSLGDMKFYVSHL